MVQCFHGRRLGGHIQQAVKEAPRDLRVAQSTMARDEGEPEALGKGIEVFAVVLGQEPSGQTQGADSGGVPVLFDPGPVQL